MKYKLSSHCFNFFICSIILVILSWTQDVGASNDVNMTSSSDEVSSSSSRPIQPGATTFVTRSSASTSQVSHASTTFPTTTTSLPLKSDVLTPATAQPETEVFHVLLYGTITNDSLAINYNELQSYLGPQLTGLCRLREGDNRITNINVYVTPRSNTSTSEIDTVRFELKPGTDPTNSEAVQNILNLIQSNNQVFLVMPPPGPQFHIGLPSILNPQRSILSWTDQSPCPQQSCPSGKWCNANSTGTFYCEAESVCSTCEVTTKVSSKNSSLGLLGLLVIPIVIAVGIVIGAIYLYKQRQSKLKKKELAATLEESGKKQVYQNTVGKSYATFFNKSVFDGETGSDHAEHKSTIRL